MNCFWLVSPPKSEVDCLVDVLEQCECFKGEARYGKDQTSQLACAQKKLNRKLIELLIMEAPLGERLDIRGSDRYRAD